MNTTLRILVVLPAYQAAAVLGATLHRLFEFADRACVLVVDDGSTDGTSDVAHGEKVRVLRISHNGGKGGALAAALALAHREKWDWVITMDADGQHSPADLDIFLQRIACAAPKMGILLGTRDFRWGVMPWPRILSNTISSWLLSAAIGCRVRDSQCGYRAYRVALHSQQLFPSVGRFEWESRVLARAHRQGWILHAVPVTTRYEKMATSHIRPWRDTWRFLIMLWRLRRET